MNVGRYAELCAKLVPYAITMKILVGWKKFVLI